MGCVRRAGANNRAQRRRSRRRAWPAPLVITPFDVEIAPCHREQHDFMWDGDEDGRDRGRAIHRFLELLCTEERDGERLHRRVAAELGIDVDDGRLAAWWHEAAAVFDEPALRNWFDATRYDRAYNEVPIQYRHGDALVHGVIDRLVVRGDVCVVIDYKTHRGAAERPDEYAARFAEQLRLYANGAAQLWPGRKVETYLLFTAGRRLYAGS